MKKIKEDIKVIDQWWKYIKAKDILDARSIETVMRKINIPHFRYGIINMETNTFKTLCNNINL